MKAQTLLKVLLILIFISFSLCLSGQKAKFTYICPIPGSSNLNPEQNIILKCEEGFKINSLDNFHVVINGSENGLYATETMLSEDEKTLIIKTVRHFRQGEKIQLSIKEGLQAKGGKFFEEVNFEFDIIAYDRNEIWTRLKKLEEEAVSERPKGNVNQLKSSRENTLPDDYPVMTVYSYGPHDEKYIFANLNCRNPNLPWNKFISIFDSYGTPIFFQESDLNCINFGPLPNGTLCYATNLVVNTEDEKYYIMDSSYVLIDSVNTGNGYILDAHELVLLTNGHYLVMSYDPQPVNMSLVVTGGNPNAIVTGLVIQEVDNNQNVFFQWRSWDHFQITDATNDIDLTAQGIDYVHGNAFEIDHDGHILLSSRHLDEITKISMSTGDVLWRFGKNSENNMFTISDDPNGFTHQHDIEKLQNANYTIFDNGNLRNPTYSRVLEYWIDENTLTASLVWEYDHGKTIYAGSAGSFRTQANGERIIGWGGTFPEAITELQADNSLLREFHFPDYVNSYRAIKASWETNVFKTRDQLSMGNYTPFTGEKKNYLYIYNQADDIIKISSVHHHLADFEILTALPRSILPNSYTYLVVAFAPGHEGDITDRLTLNFDNADTSQRIARQLELKGTYIHNSPALVYDPSFGSTNVNPETEITVNFSEAVTKVIGGEITNADIPYLFEMKYLNYKGDDIPISGIINDEKTQITILPGVMLEENKQYYLKLKGSMVKDYNGNIMILDEESYFTTGMMTGIDIYNAGELIISPNPFRDELIIEGMQEGKKRISIYTVSGQLVLDNTIESEKASIDMSDTGPGLYLISILNKESGKSTISKIIKSAASY